MRPLTTLRLMLAAQHLTRRARAALDLCAVPLAVAAQAACDVADAVGRAMDRRARVRGCVDAECDQPENEAQHMAIVGSDVTVCGRDLASATEPGEVGVSYPYSACRRVYYTTERERVTCWRCRDGLAWVDRERRREPAPEPIGETCIRCRSRRAEFCDLCAPCEEAEFQEHGSRHFDKRSQADVAAEPPAPEPRRAWPVAPGVLTSEAPRVGCPCEGCVTCACMDAPPVDDDGLCIFCGGQPYAMAKESSESPHVGRDLSDKDRGTIADIIATSERAEAPRVGDSYTHRDHPGAVWEVARFVDGAPYPYTLADGLGHWRFATAAELADPAGPWRRVTDDAPPTPATHGAAVVHYSADPLRETPTACGIRFEGQRCEWTWIAEIVTCPACRRALAPEVLASAEECEDGAALRANAKGGAA